MSSTTTNSASLPLARMDPTEASIFTAGLDDVTLMSSILQELYHTDEQSVLSINQEGLRLITAGEKTFQVSAFFAASTFQRYTFDARKHDRVHFRLALRDFIECLNLLRDDPLVEGDKAPVEENFHSDTMTTSLWLQYRKVGEPLRLKLENKTNYVIECQLTGYSRPHDFKFCPLAFQDGEDTAVIVLNSKKFYDYVSGLDLTSSELIHLVMSRGEVPVKLSTKSTLLGEVELEITSNEREIIQRDIIVSDNCLFSHKYKTQFVKPAFEALRSSELVQLKCGSSGLLCVEHIHCGSGLDRSSGRECTFKRPMTTSTANLSRDHEVNDLTSDYNLGQNKRSSVEYFILSEAKPADACPDYNFY